MASPAQGGQMNPQGAQIRPQGQQNPMSALQQGKGPSSPGQPTYQPVGVNNPPASYNPVAPVPNDQSPFGMNANANDNRIQNQNTFNTNDYSTVLPATSLMQGQPKQWYPGMYPSTQPQFGSNPYAPQTANVQGHPGHNPSTIASVEPNMANTAMSNQGQFVQRMASGGNSSFTSSPRMWNGPVGPTTSNYQSQNPADAFYSMKGLGQPNKVSPPSGNYSYGKGPDSVVGQMINQDPRFAESLGVNKQVQQPEQVAPVNPTAQVYKPTYEQYAGLPNLRG